MPVRKSGCLRAHFTLAAGEMIPMLKRSVSFRFSMRNYRVALGFPGFVPLSAAVQWWKSESHFGGGNVRGTKRQWPNRHAATGLLKSGLRGQMTLPKLYSVPMVRSIRYQQTRQKRRGLGCLNSHNLAFAFFDMSVYLPRISYTLIYKMYGLEMKCV